MTTAKSSISAASLLSLPDDTLLRIFYFVLKSPVLDATAFARLNHALPLAISCSRLHSLFFTSFRAIDLATLHYEQTAHYHGKACDTCSTLVTVSALFVFIRRASSNLHTIRLPPLPIHSTATLMTYISQYCPRLEQLHFTDNSAVILPLALSLLRLPELTRLVVLNPSELILSALVSAPNSLTHLSLFCVDPRDAPSLINFLQRNAHNLRSFTLSFAFTHIITDLFDAPAALPLSITAFLDYLTENLTTDMPSLEHLDICTATTDDVPDQFEAIAHQPVDLPSLQLTTRKPSDKTLRHLVLRTVLRHFVETLLPFKHLLKSRVHFVLALEDAVLDLPAGDLKARRKLLQHSELPSKVLSARVEADAHRIPEIRLEHADYSCLNTLAIISGRGWRPPFPVMWDRTRLLSILKSAKPSLTTVRFLAFPSLHVYKKDNAAPWIVDVLNEAPNVTTVDLSADYVISASRGKSMAAIAHAMANVRVLRVITGLPRNECRDGGAMTPVSESAKVVLDLIGAVPDLLKWVAAACGQMQRIECHCFLPAGCVQMTEASGFLLRNALASVDGTSRACAGLDTWSVRSQLCVWQTEFEKMRRLALCL